MTIYIKGFKFAGLVNKPSIKFSYYNGEKWKRLVVNGVPKGENVAVYSRTVFNAVINDVCGTERDTIKRDRLLRDFEAHVASSVQLNAKEFADATKIFN